MQTSMRVIAGIDEVGRGPLAGPVVACALVCKRKNLVRMKDSKRLSAKQRELFYRAFLDDPEIHWGIGRVEERMIDKINILQATRLAMRRALVSLSRKVRPAFLFVDGTIHIETTIPQKAVVKGDETIALCAMASIVAKVTRDRLMQRYHKRYPHYGFHQHKGYGTKAHLKALRRHGVSPIHRRTFGPCKSLPAMVN